MTLNDENPEVRLIAIRLVGRLAHRNPAYALPALRRHLLQLLAELDHSTESHMREEGARNMAALVRSCERLVTPYISPILRVLMNKLRRPEDGKGSAARGSANPGDGSSTGVSGPKNGETVHQSGKIVELVRVDGDAPPAAAPRQRPPRRAERQPRRLPQGEGGAPFEAGGPDVWGRRGIDDVERPRARFDHRGRAHTGPEEERPRDGQEMSRADRPEPRIPPPFLSAPYGVARTRSKYIYLTQQDTSNDKKLE